MLATDPCFLPLSKLALLLKSRDLSVLEITQCYLNRIEKKSHLNAFITVCKNEAIEDAKRADSEISSGQYKGLLHGIPLAVKDLIASKGILTTSGSRILKNNIPDYDATVLAKLKEAGAILLGKLQLCEFAGGDDINPLTGKGPVKNPWHEQVCAGGSSSGSAVAVAASLCAGSLGTDTGGSIRSPSAYTGIVGMKPTFGRVSRFGITPLSLSLDHVGPMSKTVEDNAILLECIAGFDTKDRHSSSEPVSNFRKKLKIPVQGLRIGLPKKFFFEYATQEVCDAVLQAAKELERQGSVLIDVELPHLKYAFGVEFAILLSEARAFHMQYLNQDKENEYTPTFKYGVLEPAKTLTGVDYVQAKRIRNFIIRDFENVYSKVDILLTPGAEAAAPPLDEEGILKYTTQSGLRSPIEMWTRIYFPANLSGVPSLVMPCGFSKTGLPLSLSLMGRHFDEATVYQVAHAYEKATHWHTFIPSV